jgi:hypothetical protein
VSRSLVGRCQILVVLVNMSVLSTEITVQNCRTNYFVLKLRAATRITLILHPAIVVLYIYCGEWRGFKKKRELEPERVHPNPKSKSATFVLGSHVS